MNLDEPDLERFDLQPPPFQCPTCGFKSYDEHSPCDCPPTPEAVDPLAMIAQAIDAAMRDVRRILVDAVVAGDRERITEVEGVLHQSSMSSLKLSHEAAKFWHVVREQQIKRGVA